MRRLLPVFLVAALLVPVAVAAQRSSPATRIPETQAQSVALERVRTDLGAGKLAAWGGGLGGGIRPASVAASRTLFNPTGGKNGSAIYVVLVGAPQAKGQVRVIVDAASGDIISSTHRDFGNNATPDWWVKGLNSPPGAR